MHIIVLCSDGIIICYLRNPCKQVPVMNDIYYDIYCE